MADKRRDFVKTAVGMGAGASMAAMAMAAEKGARREKVAGGVRLGNLYFSSGLTAVRPEARQDPLAFGGDVAEQTEKIMEMHKKNLESMGSSLDNVLKVVVLMADVKTEKPAMNKAYAKFFPKDPPARSAYGVEFPDVATRVEIEIVAWIPDRAS
ncbi:MAG: RidA family protein [Bryobacterales bacterium]|nr:RidA family protein [Bryobacterales bacterium]